ncbi:MAG: hypothetical protein IJF78_05270 [Clostridia bacterium]|nr:hypothetical protein [Clostridia bacterium]
MKRFFLLLLAVLMTGCTQPDSVHPSAGGTSGNPDTPFPVLTANPMHAMPDLAEGYTILAPAADRIYPWNGLYCTVTDFADGWEIGTCTTDGQTYTPLYTTDCMVRDLFVCDGGIFLLTDDGLVTRLDHAGTVLGTYETDCDYTDEVQRSMNGMLCADSTHLIVTWWTGEESSRNESGIIDWTYPAAIFSLQDGSRTDLMLDTYILAMAKWDKDSGDFALIQPDGEYMISGHTAYSASTVSRLDPETGKITPDDGYDLPHEPELCYNPADGRVYYDSSNKSNAAEYAYSVREDEGIYRIRTLHAADRYEDTIAAAGEDGVRPTGGGLFFTGHDIILYDRANHCVTVLDMSAEQDEVLTLLVPHNRDDSFRDSSSKVTESLAWEISEFEKQTGAFVNSLAYPADQLVERLRMKLLAGENDFDVVYYDTKYDNITASLLNYGLYLPLEESAVIDANFDHFMDGVREIMTFDGHLYGIPRSIAPEAVFIGTEYRMAGLPQIDADWTADDFRTVCEEAAALDGDVNLGYPLSGVTELLETGLQTGKMDEDAIAECLAMEKKYRDAGLFRGSEPAPVLNTLPLYPTLVKNLLTPRYRDRKVVPVPSVSGVRYARADAFLFVNGKTEHRELALRYLEILSSPETAGQMVTGKSMLLKDPALYWELSGGMNLDLSWNEYEKVQPEDMEDVERLCEAMEAALAGCSPYIYILDSDFRDEIGEITDSVMDGTLTPEEGAKKLSYAAKYRYIE